MKIKMLKTYAAERHIFMGDTTLDTEIVSDLDEKLANQLVTDGFAEVVTETPVEIHETYDPEDFE